MVDPVSSTAKSSDDLASLVNKFSREATTFNFLVLLYLMAECGGNGQYLVAFNGERIVAVSEVGKRRKADELVERKS